MPELQKTARYQIEAKTKEGFIVGEYVDEPLLCGKGRKIRLTWLILQAK
jgi:hypothetical protein